MRATNWLGDVVLSLPALHAVRTAFPAARLSVLVRRELAGLFDGTTWIDEVVAYAQARGLGRLGAAPRLVADLRARRFDLVLLFPTSFESALWPMLAGIPRRIGYAGDWRRGLLTESLGPPPPPEAHEVHWYLDLVRRGLGVEGPPGPVAPEVHPPHRERMTGWLAARRRRPGTRLIAVAPAAAYGPAKEWPASRWTALVDRLAEEAEAECVLIGAPSERSRCEEVAAASRAGALVAAGETSVGELVALLDVADGFAGNDSGAMHVAAALGRPTVGIFGSTSPERTGPHGPSTRVLRERLPCSPCLARTCRYGHYDCLTRIEVAEVAGALAELGALAA